MGNSKRLKKNKHQAMARRLRGCKKPMAPEQKKIERARRKAQSEAQRKINEAAKAK